AFTPDGRRLAVSSNDGAVRLWDVRDGQLLLTLEVPQHIVRTIAFSPDGLRLAAGCDTTIGRPAVVPWDSDVSWVGRTLRGPSGPVYQVAYGADGGRVASGGQDGTVRLWEAASGEPLQVLQSPGGPILFLGFSDDRGQLFCQSTGGESVWEVATGRP